MFSVQPHGPASLAARWRQTKLCKGAIDDFQARPRPVGNLAISNFKSRRCDSWRSWGCTIQHRWLPSPSPESPSWPHKLSIFSVDDIVLFLLAAMAVWKCLIYIFPMGESHDRTSYFPFDYQIRGQKPVQLRLSRGKSGPPKPSFMSYREGGF